MPILGAIVLVIQACFAYHALKTGRPYWWLFVIMGFPVMGCLLYYFIEVFPSSPESRSAQKAARAIAKALDPDKELRARVADVEACGSVENRIALARECMAERMYLEAATLYRSCLSGVYENDPRSAMALPVRFFSTTSMRKRSPSRSACAPRIPASAQAMSLS